MQEWMKRTFNAAHNNLISDRQLRKVLSKPGEAECLNEDIRYLLYRITRTWDRMEKDFYTQDEYERWLPVQRAAFLLARHLTREKVA